ncbi:hypothetical protein HPB50_014664 [Hyalomma asiaticum]|uniref:Uncharacterized protein n=1 Tax=Hyalomma asiaticum TaxID=266040 RepID=A0ACB7S8Z0_HYAAI|nr:hypothetical protein HPB50_014664 [Hyalomma asiaticum]
MFTQVNEASSKARLDHDRASYGEAAQSPFVQVTVPSEPAAKDGRIERAEWAPVHTECQLRCRGPSIFHRTSNARHRLYFKWIE